MTWSTEQRRLRGQPVAGRAGGTLGGLFPGGAQLGPRPVSEGLQAKFVEDVVGGAELLAGVAAAPLPAQPFSVHQVGAG
jgi:hypothetical protein